MRACRFGQRVTRLGRRSGRKCSALSWITVVSTAQQAALTRSGATAWRFARLSCQRLMFGSTQERKLFDERFIRLDTRRLCELTSAADALGMKSLVDLTSRALARMIEGKTPEEIRETFHLPDDLTGASLPAALAHQCSRVQRVQCRGREAGAAAHRH